MYDFVLDVREKVAISNHGNVGAYGFATGAQLRVHCEAVIDDGATDDALSPTSSPHSPSLRPGTNEKRLSESSLLPPAAGSPSTFAAVAHHSAPIDVVAKA